MEESILRIHFRNFAEGIYTFEQFKTIISDLYIIKTSDEYNADINEKNRLDLELSNLIIDRDNLIRRKVELESDKNNLEKELELLNKQVDEIKTQNIIRY